MNTKLKCLLLDDEIPGLTYLKLLCEQIPELEIIKVFNDTEIFQNEIAELEFDLCILDIEMPGQNGIQLAKLLKGKSVIFTTAYTQYAVDAFELEAVDYLVKPITYDRLLQAIHKVLKRSVVENRVRHFVQLNTNKGMALLYFDELVLIKTSEIDSRDKIAILSNGTALQLKNISFDKITSLLPERDFCRINKKELVALKSVRYYSKDQITTDICFQSEKAIVLNLGEIFRNEFIRKVNS